MQCSVLKQHVDWNKDIKYDDIYGSLEEQVEVIKLISSLLEVRERLLEVENHPEKKGHAYRGLNYGLLDVLNINVLGLIRKEKKSQSKSTKMIFPTVKNWAQ